MTEFGVLFNLSPMSSNDSLKLDSKKSIIQAATKLFARLGLDKCSTREIAKESDSNISLISYYFGGKEGLYKEVMRDHALEIKQSVQKIFQHSEEHPKTKESFVFQVGLMIENMIYFRLNYPEMSKIFAREKLTGMEHAKEIHEEIFYPMAQKFFEIFREGQKRGYVNMTINPALFFVALSEGIWGFFEIIECDTNFKRDCDNLFTNQQEFKNQIIKIYLTGVLL
jgi:AcrR family transcriptional regulator